MRTDELIEEIQKKQSELSDAMLSTYKEYGWIFDEAPCSDIKAKTKDGYKMRIDDGRCPDIVGALTYIYGQGGSVFEGRVESV